MNKPNLSPPLPAPRTELPQGTLDERIASAERRLVSREQAMRHSAQGLLQRAQEATNPRRVVRPAAYALGALAVVWGALRLLRRRRGARRPDTTASLPTTSAARSASRFGEVPWVRAATLLWPLLPVAWRGRMGPDPASMLVTLGVPLAGLLFGKRTRAPLRSQRSEKSPSSERNVPEVEPTQESR